MAVLKLKSDAGREGIKLFCPPKMSGNSLQDSESKKMYHNGEYSFL
jgi:hypothetical protein